MHDLGKIGIPDRVLLKPGKLDADEWEIMKTHATIGSELLSGHGSELMKMAQLIALSHHEKWDGTGYPNCVKGEDIPIEGRICALADVYDALTSKRPYKKAWSSEDAVKEIKNLKGKNFDPNMVEAFLKIVDEFINISTKYSDS